MLNEKTKNSKIVHNILFTIYIIFSLSGLFGLIVAGRVSHFEYITHITVINLLSILCVAFMLNKKIVFLFVGVVVFGSPAYYFDGYKNLRNNEFESFHLLRGGINNF